MSFYDVDARPASNSEAAGDAALAVGKTEPEGKSQNDTENASLPARYHADSRKAATRDEELTHRPRQHDAERTEDGTEHQASYERYVDRSAGDERTLTHRVFCAPLAQRTLAPDESVGAMRGGRPPHARVHQKGGSANASR